MASHDDSPLPFAHQDSQTNESSSEALVSGKNVDDGGGKERESSSASPPPPPPPPHDDATDSSQLPPLSPSHSSRRQHMTTNQISDVTFEGSPEGNAWDSKKVAKEIEEVSRQDEKEQSMPHANRNKFLTLSQVSKTCPVEEEAQKLIFKAIDEKKDRGVMGSSSILPHVPAKASPKAFEATPPASTSHDESANLNIAPMEKCVQGDATNANSVRGPSLHGSVPCSSHASSAQLADSSASANGTRRKWGGLGNLFSFSWKRHEQEGQELEVTSPKVSYATKSGSNTDDLLFQNANTLFRRSIPNSSVKDIEQGVQDSSHDSDPSGKKKVKTAIVALKHMANDAKRNVKNELESYDAFLRPRKTKMMTTVKTEFLYIIFPLMIVAAILFYGTGNPIHNSSGASVSWILLFTVRNILVYTLGKATSVYVIEYLSLKRRFTVKLFGPFIALMIVQSKGYPSNLFFYGLWGVILLCGSGKFTKNWLFWQDAIDMCNASNPSGTITDQGFYPSVIGCMILFGAAVAAKRLWLGLHIAKRTFLNYNGTYTQVKDGMSLVREIARLVGFTEDTDAHTIDLGVNESLNCETLKENDDSSCASSASDSTNHYQFHVLNSSQRAIIRNHLEAWEEPTSTEAVQSDPSISDILQFRQRIAAVDDKYPFSTAFGLADTREHCFEKAQQLYYQLLLRQNIGKVLQFDSIAAVALNSDGTMDEDKMKDLVALFRPDRKGALSEMDFLKSIDSLYRDFRLLQAAIDSSGSMDRALEIMVNYAFYIVLWCIILSIVGIDPLALFLSMGSLVIGFSFMVGSAASKYFEGVLFILFRRPYDVGDRISVSNVEHDTSSDGSTTWFVENLGLYSTTVRLAATNEVATYSNGSLASSRIINAKRSEKAIVAVYLKFADETRYDKLRVFRKTVEKFVKERPREWISLQSFRPVDVEQDQGYVQYKVQLQHRESWQNLNSILNSKSEVTSFSLEASKQLGMRYVAPPLPVDLHMDGNSTKAIARTSTVAS